MTTTISTNRVPLKSTTTPAICHLELGLTCNNIFFVRENKLKYFWTPHNKPRSILVMHFCNIFYLLLIGKMYPLRSLCVYRSK